MDNPVVVRCAEVAQEAGIATLRFNFRGVGASTGTHDEGRGERNDAESALAALARRLRSDRPVALLGYSFGARVAAGLAASGARLPGLGLVAPPLAMGAVDDIPRGPELLMAAGDRDPYCPAADLEALAARHGTRARIVPGAEHFFFGKLYPLGEIVSAWLGRWAVDAAARG